MARAPMTPLGIANMFGQAAHKKQQLKATAANPDPDNDGDNDIVPASSVPAKKAAPNKQKESKKVAAIKEKKAGKSMPSAPEHGESY